MNYVLRWLMPVAAASILLSMIAVAAAEPEVGQPDTLGGLFGASPSTKVSAVAIEAQFIAPKGGQPGRLFLTAKVAPGYHIYSITQAPGGPIATKIVVNALHGVRIGPFRASVEPDRKQEPVFDNLTVETHQGTVTWSAPLELDAGIDPATLKITGTVTVQACTDTACLPPTSIAFTAVLGSGVNISLPAPGPAGGVLPGAGRTSHSAPSGFDASQVRAEEVVEVNSLWRAILFAFAGGLILNVMPCVLPVIGLKVLSFFQQAGQSRSRAFVLNLWYSLGLLSVFLVLAAFGVGLSEMFTAELFGVIMAAIVFAMALNLMGVWEFEMPSVLGAGRVQALTQEEGAAGAFFKGIVTTLLAIPCGAPLLSPALTWVDQEVRNGSRGSVYLVFAVIGLGMASPYLLMGAFPELLRFLPKPGAWMDTFKKAMGYCLLVAVVWILTFVPLADIVPTVGLLFGIWLACWLIGRLGPTASERAKTTAWIAAAAVAVLTAWVCFPWLVRPAMQARLDRYVEREIGSGRYDEAVMNRSAAAGADTKQAAPTPISKDIPKDPKDPARPTKAALPWRPFDRAAFESLAAGGQTVLIDFTADWCLTCKTLEAFVLDTRKTRALIDRNRVVTLRADWTDRAADVTAMLEILGGKQVPVVAIFPAGNPNHPIILRGGCTQQMLLDALKKAGPSRQ
jgi:thiol:disulfide interchange protein DsbD